jgi:ubiquinone/menaquinone biosynthesis C-methylase UbiE
LKESIFNTLAGRYDAWYDSSRGKPLYESELACLRPLVEASPRPLLEVGVGTGRFAMHFLPATGIDPAEEALKLAAKRGIKTLLGRAEALPLPEGSFGCALLALTLCFVQEPLRVLREVHRVLRPEGLLVLAL